MVKHICKSSSSCSGEPRTWMPITQSVILAQNTEHQSTLPCASSRQAMKCPNQKLAIHRSVVSAIVTTIFTTLIALHFRTIPSPTIRELSWCFRLGELGRCGETRRRRRNQDHLMLGRCNIREVTHAWKSLVSVCALVINMWLRNAHFHCIKWPWDIFCISWWHLGEEKYKKRKAAQCEILSTGYTREQYKISGVKIRCFYEASHGALEHVQSTGKSEFWSTNYWLSIAYYDIWESAIGFEYEYSRATILREYQILQIFA